MRPLRTTSAPTPFGPPNLCPEIATRSAGAVCTRQVEPLRRLDRVGVQHRIGRVLAHQRRDGIEWLHDTGLVVDEHHRHDRGARIERLRERVEVDATVGVARRSWRRGTLRARAARPRRARPCARWRSSRRRRARGAPAPSGPRPSTARLSASLPLPVKTTSFGVAPSASATISRASSSAVLVTRDAPWAPDGLPGDSARNGSIAAIAAGSHRGRSRVVQVGGHPAIVGVGFADFGARNGNKSAGCVVVSPDGDTPVVSETIMPTGPESNQQKPATQLRLLPSGVGRLEWSLDERTRTGRSPGRRPGPRDPAPASAAPAGRRLEQGELRRAM